MTLAALVAGVGMVPARAQQQSRVSADIRIKGAGATFPWPVYKAWMARYQRETGVAIDYDPVGSGAGIEQVSQGLVDFGATDVPLSDADLDRLHLAQFPAVIGGVVPVVNINGLKPGSLRLTGEVLGDIYLGLIPKWNDPAIIALNPGVALPDAYITVVHRTDASGTTYLWSEYLSRSNPEWKERVGTGTTLSWPKGVGAKGNEGVASSVQRTRSSIGYVEYAYAVQHKLRVVELRNRAGSFVAPGEASLRAAAGEAPWSGSADLVQLLIDQPGAASWPITGTSFILLPVPTQSDERTEKVAGFFRWVLDHGEEVANELAYVPMPRRAVELIERSTLPDKSAHAGEAASH